jgi:DHA2 family multidrug resistance protein
MSLRLLQEFRDQQASSLAYFDVFWVIGMMSFVLVFLVLLMRRSAAEKGAAIGAE